MKGKYRTEDMYKYLKQVQGHEIFQKKGDIGFAGRAGGKKLAFGLISDLEEEGEVSLTKLQKMILSGE